MRDARQLADDLTAIQRREHLLEALNRPAMRRDQARRLGGWLKTCGFVAMAAVAAFTAALFLHTFINL